MSDIVLKYSSTRSFWSSLGPSDFFQIPFGLSENKDGTFNARFTYAHEPFIISHSTLDQVLLWAVAFGSWSEFAWCIENDVEYEWYEKNDQMKQVAQFLNLGIFKFHTGSETFPKMSTDELLKCARDSKFMTALGVCLQHETKQHNTFMETIVNLSKTL